jgi:fucose permease
VFLVFFLISLLTNIMGALIPEIIRSFQLSLTAAGLLPFVFFLSYGLVSIPAGLLIEQTPAKNVVLGALALEAGGALLLPLQPVYATALASFFLIGIGAAALQVIINPLLRTAGGEEHYAFNSAMAQFIFGSGSFLGPLLYSYLVVNLSQGREKAVWLGILSWLTPRSMPWVSVYWVFALAAFAVLAVALLVRMPGRGESITDGAGTRNGYGALVRMPVVWLYFTSIFLYVGLEQGLANWMSQFLFSYHAFDPRTTGALAVSWFWGSMTLGCAVGMILLKVLDSKLILKGLALGALLVFTAAIAGPAWLSVVAFPLMGLCLSVMWPVIFSLGLNSLSHSHGLFAGILCSGIVGGAMLPLMAGQLGDQFGLRSGMLLLYVSIGWIFAIGFWAKPLINNATVRNQPQSADPAGVK